MLLSAVAWSAPKRLVNVFAVLWPWFDVLWSLHNKRFCVFKRLTILASIVAFGLMVGGCSKCGFWLDEWLERPAKTCKGDFPR